MSRPRVDPRTSRIAVLGAETPSGALVREALAQAGVAGDRVELFGPAGGDAVLSEYAGEARLIQQAAPGDEAAHDVVFVCENGPEARRAVAEAVAERLVLDLAGASRGDREAPVVDAEINPEGALHHRGIVRVPHPIARILAEIVAPIDRLAGVRRATAFVLRPASDFGEAGLAELRDQALGLLRFADTPKEVFGGRQLAFNVIAQSLLPAGSEPALEERLAEEVGAILGWTERRLSVSLAVVPVFHGHCVSVALETDRPAQVPDLRAALEGSGAGARKRAAVPQTPVEAGETERIGVTEIADDGRGGFWIRALAGQAGLTSAARAVQLARKLGNL